MKGWKENMSRDYKALLEAGNKAQMEKLEQNGHKEGFDDSDIFQLESDMVNEVSELEDEIYDEFTCIETDLLDYAKIRHEAADIANFAHMIILACDKELSK